MKPSYAIIGEYLKKNGIGCYALCSISIITRPLNEENDRGLLLIARAIISAMNVEYYLFPPPLGGPGRKFIVPAEDAAVVERFRVALETILPHHWAVEATDKWGKFTYGAVLPGEDHPVVVFIRL